MIFDSGGNEKRCSKCGSIEIEYGRFDSKNGTPVKCLECGNIIVINHQDYDDESMGKLD